MADTRVSAVRAVFVYNTASYLIRFRSELIRALQERGYECHAALPKNILEHEQATLQDMGVTVHLLERFVDQRITPITDIRLTLEYYRLYSALKPDMVINFTIKPCIYSSIAARIAGVRTIAAMITGLGYVFTDTSAKGRVISFIAALAYRFALHERGTVFFQNTEDHRYFLERGIVAPSDGVLVNGSGVDVGFFQPASSKPESGPVFLMVARLLRDKGVVEYLEACRIARQKLQQARFLLVGPFDQNPSGIAAAVLQPYIDDGTVEYLGQLVNPLPAYHEATIYVLPSYSEGRPRTVLEAMACGLAIITTDARGCRETIEPGVNGYLVPPRSAQALSARMIELGRDAARAREMGAASRWLAETRYDVRQVTAKICEALCAKEPKLRAGAPNSARMQARS